MKTSSGDPAAIYTNVGKAIQEARNRRKMTQEQLAKAISLTRTSITNIEKGRQKILLHTLFDVAAALDVEPTLLIASVPGRDIQAAPPMMPDGISDRNRKLIEAAIKSNKKGK